MKSIFNMKGTERAAALLVVLGKDVASDIMKHLDEDSVELISQEMMKIEGLDQGEKEELFGEFMLELKKSSGASTGGVNKAREMLFDAFGKERADELINKIEDSDPESGFKFLNEVDVSVILSLISGENSQMVALIFSYLTPQKAARVLKELPREKAQEVAVKLAKLSNPSPEAAVAVSRVLKEKYKIIKEKEGQGDSETGVNSLVNILAHMTSEQERNIIGSLDIQEPALKKKIMDKIFVFDNIINLSNNEIRIIIDELNDDILVAKALKGAGDNIRFKFLRNMSQNRATDILSEMDLMGPVRIEDIEEARNSIVDLMKILDENGVITIKRDGEIYID